VVVGEDLSLVTIEVGGPHVASTAAATSPVIVRHRSSEMRASEGGDSENTFCRARQHALRIEAAAWPLPSPRGCRALRRLRNRHPIHGDERTTCRRHKIG
jgi:hypothetical protein